MIHTRMVSIWSWAWVVGCTVGGPIDAPVAPDAGPSDARVCVPGEGTCDGAAALRCRADGSGWELTELCDPTLGESCGASGHCMSSCDVAALTRSYVGCEYWPVTTMNAALSRQFTYAVIVSNAHPIPAHVLITRGDTEVAFREVAPGSVEVIELPYVPELQGRDDHEASALVRDGAHHLVSTLPVTVHQYNPLEFLVGHTYSLSNDASLLFPQHALTGNYLVSTRPSFHIVLRDAFTHVERNPGLVTIVGTEPTPTDVAVRFSAHVLGSADGAVRAFAPGDVAHFVLRQGDVLQLASASSPDCLRPVCAGGLDGRALCACDETDGYDLTGTEIRASGAVSVIAGHDCAYVPFDQQACDHLEESLLPEEAWGRDVVVGATLSLNGEPAMIQVVSGRDDNRITFEPESVHAPVVLDRGDTLDVLFSAPGARVRGAEPVLVSQLLVNPRWGGTGPGDPALTYAVPPAQFRSDYVFHVPSTYERDLVNVVAPDGAEVRLDGAVVSGFVPIGDTGYRVASIEVEPGPHRLVGTAPFGATLYGFAEHTSYLLPAGLDLRHVEVPF